MAGGPYALRFQMAGVPVAIEPTFWLGAVLLGSGLRGQKLVLWVAIVLVAVLVHELGHALAFRRFGVRSEVLLQWVGGLTIPERSARGLGRWRDVTVSLAGPFAGFVLGGLVLLVERFVPMQGWVAGFLVGNLKFVTFFWGLANLLPVLPLDGGHVADRLLGPRRHGIALGLSVVTAALVVAAGLWLRMPYLAGLFGLLGIQSLVRLSELRRARRTSASPRSEAPATTAAWVREGWTALQGGWDAEAGRLGTRALEAAGTDAARAEAVDLLAWTSLAQGSPAHALSYLRRIPPSLARSLTWARALLDSGRPADAVPHAEAALAREPGDAAAALLVQALVGSGRAPDAERLLLAHGWGSAAARARAEGQVALALGNFEPATAAFQRAFQQDGREDDALAAARALVRSGQAERAAAWLQEAARSTGDVLTAARADEELAAVPAGHGTPARA